MNPDNSSREDLELRITMLLLGELPAGEAEALRQTIAQDAGLKKLHDELQSTIGLVREVEKNPTDTASENSAALKLSDERRQKLLAHFKTPRPQESFWIRPMKLPSLIPVLVVIAIVAMLAAMMLPALSKAKNRSARAVALSQARQKALEEQMAEADKKIENNIVREKVDVPGQVAAIQPGTVSVPPEPVLAPPPASIVLPPTESPATVTTGSLADSEKGPRYTYGLYPTQNNPGRQLSISAGAGTAAIAPVDLFAIQPNSGVQSVTLGVNPSGGFYGVKDATTIEMLPPAAKSDGTLAQDGKLLYEMGKLKESEDMLNKALAKNPDDSTAQYYLTLDKQAAYNRAIKGHSPDPQARMEQVEKQWTAPSGTAGGKVVGVVNAFAGAGGGGGGGGQPSTSNVELALNSSDLQRARTENGPLNFDDETRLKVPAVQAQSFDAPAFDSKATPEGLAAGIVTGVASTDRESKNSDNRFVNRYAFAVDADKLSQSQLGALHQADIADINSKPAVPAQIVLNDSASATPMGGFPGVSAGEDDYQVAQNKKFGAGKEIVKGAAQLRSIEPASSRRGFYKITPLPGHTAAVGGDENMAVQAGMAEPMVPNSAPIVLPPAEVPALATGPSAGQALDFKTDTLAAGDRAGGTDTSRLYRNLAREGKDLSGSAAPPVVVAPMSPTSVGAMDNSGRVELVLDGTSASTSGTTFAARNPANVTATDSFQTGLAKDDVAGLRYVMITNGLTAPVVIDHNSFFDANKTMAKTDRDVLEKNLANKDKTGLPPATAPSPSELAVKEAVLRQADVDLDKPLPKTSLLTPIPQPEILTSENAFSTFSLNVSDVSFKLAEASLEKGQMPDAAAIRSEEFINAFDYRDPEAAVGQPMAFASERARYPFAHNRELLRFSIKTAAMGRPAGRALNLVLLLDNSGSMERADRVAIIREALRVLAGQLQPQDTVSVVTFARTARLWADGIAGDKAGATLAQVGDITPEGGTNLEEAMRLAYETAHRHYLANGLNRVVLLTDGAANLGNVEPAVLKQKVEAQRKQGIALDCFGIGFEDYDDDLLEQLSRNGDGRYAFINAPEDAGKEFATKLAGALQIAASDVKVQVEFNPQRVISYRQIGYAKHQLTKEQFRDNTVDAAEIAAQEAGNALYTVETKPDGTGPVATVHVRYKVPGTTDYQERSWDVAYEANAPALEQASPAMRLAGTASAFSEWLAVSPFAQEVTPDELLKVMSGVPEIYGADERPKKLEWMIRQAKSLSGK